MKYIVWVGTMLGCVLHLLGASAFDSQVKVPLPATADPSFASAVALSGSTIVVGAPFEDANAFFAGSAYVFVNTNDVWVQQARLIADEPLDFESFGSAVAISGDTIVIGSYGDSATQDGAAYVFTRTGDTWTFQQRLAPSDPAPFQLFGTSVSISGDTIAVGSFSDADALTPYAGAVYAFVRNGASWSQQQKIVADVPLSGELLGFSVAIEGDAIAAGAPYGDNYAGAAYLFTRSGSAWTQIARLSAVNPSLGALMGYSIALSGNTVLAGAPSDFNGVAQSAGSAHVFAFDGSAWGYNILLPSNPFPQRGFGQSVALKGDVAVVGADGERDEFDLFTARGAYLFSRTANGWAETQQFTPAGAANTLHFFGISVAMSGTRIVIGDTTAAPIDSAVYVYESANTAPTIACTQPQQTFECVMGLVPVSVSVQVADEDSDELTIVWSTNGVPFDTTTLTAGTTAAGSTVASPSVSLAAGAHVFEVTVTDGKEVVSCQSIAVLNADTQAPAISSVTATPSTLKPGKVAPVQITVAATDNCSAVTNRIVNVLATETGSDKGKSKPPEWQITGPLTVELSANGVSGKKTRTYTVVIESTDASGNVSSSQVQVPVQ